MAEAAVHVNGESMRIERTAGAVLAAVRTAAARWAPRFRGDVESEQTRPPRAYLDPDGRRRAREPWSRPTAPQMAVLDVAQACGGVGAAICSQVLPDGLTCGEAHAAGRAAAEAWCEAHPWPEPPAAPERKPEQGAVQAGLFG